jgi:DNA-binding SARP family transcriptional activator
MPGPQVPHPGGAGSGGARQTGGRTWSLRLLGGLTLSCDGRPVQLPVGTQRLIALAVVLDRPIGREEAAALLWPETGRQRAAGNLRSAWWRAQQVLGPGLLSDACVLRHGPQLQIDLAAATAVAESLLDGPADGQLLLHCGELLPGWYDDWVLMPRERFAQLRVAALINYAGDLLAEQRYGRSVQAAVAAATADPLRDSAQAAVIRAHLARHDVATALACYRTFSTRLRGELGVDPSPELSSLVAGTAAGRAGAVTAG